MTLHDPNALDNSETEGLVMLLVTMYLMLLYLLEAITPWVNHLGPWLTLPRLP